MDGEERLTTVTPELQRLTRVFFVRSYRYVLYERTKFEDEPAIPV